MTPTPTAPATGTDADRADAVRAVLATIPDPEMPPVTLAELGMVEGVAVAGCRAEIELVPTFTGCPALELIEDDVVRGVREQVDGIDEVAVRWRRDVLWTSERITVAGREKLRAWGIAPPGSGQTVVAVGRLGERPSWTSPAARVTCPLCGADETVEESPFGAALCRSSHFCQACRNPFDAIKP